MKSNADQPYKGKILVVDDEEVVASMLQRWLVANGYGTRTARCFSEVQERLVQEPFDLITLDIVMPEMDGLQILRWLKEHYPHIGVVMATAREDADSVIGAMRLGAYDYLTKPFNLDLVLVEIEQAMERQRLVEENQAYQQDLEQKVAEQTRALLDANTQLGRHVRELEGMERLLRFHMSYHTLSEARREVLEAMAQVLEVEQLRIYFPASDGCQLRAVAAWGWAGQEGVVDEETVASLPVLPTESSALVAQCFREGQPCVGRGEAAIPLMHQSTLQGVLWVKYVDTEADEEEADNMLWRLGQEAALILWAAQVMNQIEQGQVQMDDLLNLEDGHYA